MHVDTPLNRHFDQNTNALVNDLVSHTKSNPPRSKRNRTSCLDAHFPEIFTQHNQGWSYQKIADCLANCYGLNNDKTKVWRRIKKFMEDSK